MGIKPTSKILKVVYLQSLTKYNIVLVHMVVLRVYSAESGIESKLTKKGQLLWTSQLHNNWNSPALNLRNLSPWSSAPEQALPNKIQVHVQNRPLLHSHHKDLNLINNQGSIDIFNLTYVIRNLCLVVMVVFVQHTGQHKTRGKNYKRELIEAVLYFGRNCCW